MRQFQFRGRRVELSNNATFTMPDHTLILKNGLHDRTIKQRETADYAPGTSNT